MFSLKGTLIILFLLSLSFLTPPMIYGVEGEGGYAGAYLRIGAGARPLGMGGAFTALSDDATASCWNAAGLGQIEDHQIALMYSIMSMDRMLNMVNYAQPLGRIGAFSINWLNFGVRDIDGRDRMGNPTEKFSDSENSFSVSFGKCLSNIIFIGGSFKYLYHKLASNQAMGYGFDIGAILYLGGNIRIGGTVQDIASKIKWDTESELEEKFPTLTRAGISILPKKIPIKISADIEKNSKQSNRYHIGVEYWIIPSIAIRTGYNRNHVTAGASAVIPISYVDLQLDYAFAPDELQQWPTNRVSMSVKF